MTETDSSIIKVETTADSAISRVDISKRAKKGTFQKGNNFHILAQKKKGGRPTKEEVAIRKRAERAFLRRLDREADKLARRYMERAMKSDRVLLDARKVATAEAQADSGSGGGGITINIVNYAEEPKPIITVKDEEVE